MKHNWIPPQSCKVCGSKLRQQFPKEKEWTYRIKCPNNCFDVIVEGDVHNVHIHTEGADHLRCFKWDDTFSGVKFDKVQKKINHALADAHKVWKSLGF